MDAEEQLRRWAQGMARWRAAKLAKIVPVTIDGEGWAEAAFDGMIEIEGAGLGLR